MPITKEELKNRISQAFTDVLPDSIPPDARADIVEKNAAMAESIADSIEEYIIGRTAARVLGAQDIDRLLRLIFTFNLNVPIYGRFNEETQYHATITPDMVISMVNLGQDIQINLDALVE